LRNTEALESRVMLTSIAVTDSTVDLPIDQSWIELGLDDMMMWYSNSSEFSPSGSGVVHMGFAEVGDTASFTLSGYGSSEIEAQYNVTVNFVAATNQPPEFEGTPDSSGVVTYTLDVPFNHAYGTVGTITATDPEGDSLYYTGGNGLFYVEEYSGNIVAMGSVTVGDTYSFTITASDYYGSDTANVIINILPPVNDPPEFDGTEQTVTLDDGTVVENMDTFEFDLDPNNLYSTYWNLPATDPDGNSLYWQADNASVYLDSYSGTFSFTGSYNPGVNYEFTATVSDGWSSDEALVTLKAGTTSNNNAPEFDGTETTITLENGTPWTGDVFEFDLDEDATYYDIIGSLPATDADGDPLSWSSDSYDFYVDSYNGDVMLYMDPSMVYDFEFFATVSDGTDTDTALVIVNYDPPSTEVEFDGLETTTWVADDMPFFGDTFTFEIDLVDVNAGNTFIGKLPATGPNGAYLTWSITADYRYSIDEYTGDLSFNDLPIVGGDDHFYGYVQDAYAMDSNDPDSDDDALVIVNYETDNNTAPVAVGDNGYTQQPDDPNAAPLWIDYYVLEGNTLTVSADDGVLKNDYDLDPNDSISAHLDSSNSPIYGNVDLEIDGSFTYTPYDWAFDDPDFEGLTDQFYYYVQDDANPSKQSNVVAVDVDLSQLKLEYQNTTGAWETVDEQLIDGFQVGSEISLRSRIIGTGSIVETEWSVLGNAIKDYAVNETLIPNPDNAAAPDLASYSTGQVVPLSVQDYKNNTIQFHWVDKNLNIAAATVKTSDGSETLLQAVFDIYRPGPTTFEVRTGIIYHRTRPFPAGAGNVGLGRTSEPGALLLHESDIEEDGTLHMTQLANTSLEATHRNGTISNQTNSGLDYRHRFPFELPSIYMNGTNYDGWVDAIGNQLSHNWKAFSRSDTFSSYLMYKPNTPGSIAVPLRVVNWSWSVSLIYQNNQWKITQKSGEQTTFYSIETNDHPFWINVIQNGIDLNTL